MSCQLVNGFALSPAHSANSISVNCSSARGTWFCDAGIQREFSAALGALRKLGLISAAGGIGEGLERRHGLAPAAWPVLDYIVPGMIPSQLAASSRSARNGAPSRAINP